MPATQYHDAAYAERTLDRVADLDRRIESLSMRIAVMSSDRKVIFLEARRDNLYRLRDDLVETIRSA